LRAHLLRERLCRDDKHGGEREDLLHADPWSKIRTFSQAPQGDSAATPLGL
jgi:hypothetical protein